MRDFLINDSKINDAWLRAGLRFKIRTVELLPN